MSRDNFSKKDIEILRTRVANRRSNPNCRVVTTGPNDNQNKATILGDAAHICAASPGGPRYDPNMTTKERKSIKNGIWLCKVCARRIDVDHRTYSKELLHQWKELAEKKTNEEVNHPLFNQAEVNQQVVTLLTGSPTTAIHNLVHNAISAEIKALEAKDPRLNIQAEFDKEGLCYSIRPKEKVILDFNFLNKNSPIIKEKYNAFIRHGRDLIIDSGEISISGSELFKEIMQEASIVRFSKPKTDATIRLRFYEEKKIIEPFNDISGTLAFGSESFFFEGYGFNNMLAINFQFNKDNTAKISTKVSLESWEGIDILKLPYFYKLWELFYKVENGWMLEFDLEISGEKMLTNARVSIQKNDFFYQIYTFLQYTNFSRAICEKLKKHIKFTTQTSFSAEEHQKIAEIKEILYNGINSKIFPEEPTKSTIIVSKENISLLKKKFEPTSIIYRQTEGDFLSLFNQSIQLPTKSITLNSVLPTVLVKNIDGIVEGNKVELVMYPVDGYELLMEYKNNI